VTFKAQCANQRVCFQLFVPIWTLRTPARKRRRSEMRSPSLDRLQLILSSLAKLNAYRPCATRCAKNCRWNPCRRG
jgi:hypothetical protein